MYRKFKLREQSVEHFNSWYRQYRLWRKWLKVSMIFMVPIGLIVIPVFVTDPKLLINVARAEPMLGITLLSWILLVGTFLSWSAYIYFILDRILERKEIQRQEALDRMILRTAHLGDDGELVFPQGDKQHLHNQSVIIEREDHDAS